MPRRSIRLLAVALLVGGCAAPAPPGPPGTVERFSPTSQVRGLGLPFDAYTMSTAELYTVENAQDRLTLECMRRRKDHWKVIRRPTTLEDLRNRRRYGVVEMDIARQYGYHVPAGLLTPVEVEETYDKRDDSLSEKQKETAYGEGGCAREAVARTTPAKRPDLVLLQKLDQDSINDAQRAPSVAAAMRSWRDCVRQAGFDYGTPFAALSDPAWWSSDSEASSREIAVAVADVACKQRTGLVEAWHAAEVRIQQEAIRTHPEKFRELHAAVVDELSAAKAILAGDGR
jgi:hypothetical protein